MMSGYNGKYKIGDVVRLRSDLVDGEEYGCNVFVSPMEGYRNKPIEIVDFCNFGYEIEVDGYLTEYNITDEMIAGYWDMFADEKDVGTTIFNSLNNNDNFPKKLKLIDVLNKIADGELKEDYRTEIKMNGLYYKLFSDETAETLFPVLLAHLNEKVELIEPQEPSDNTKIEELDMNEFAQGNEIDYRIAFKLNEVIRKLNRRGNMNEISLREGLTLLKEAYCEDLYELFAEEEDIDKIVAEAEELKAEKGNNNE